MSTATPTPISWGELYTALSQGVVDGAENNPPSFYTSKHYEVCKYLSLDEHSSVPDILVIGTITWNSLESEEKEWLMAAVKEATSYQRKLWREAEQESLTAIQEAGVKVNYPDKSEFQRKSEDMIEELKDQDKELYNLILKIKRVE